MLLMAAAPDQKADLKAIEDLHRRDVAANKAYDVEALAALWTDDVVTMPPAMAPIVGKKANRDLLESASAQAKLVDIVEYTQQWQEIQILGDYAYEWGIFRSAVKAKTGEGDPLKAEFRVMRILKRQPDNSWKVYRSIWNSAPPPDVPQAQGLPSGPVILPPPPKKP
jgi:ketosteroid isomerase-like protein